MKLKSEERITEGIYAIVNTVTKYTYIGQTGASFFERWRGHKQALNRGKHPNQGLQQDWDIYGSGAFKFIMLDKAPKVLGSSLRYAYWGDYLEWLRVKTCPYSLYNIVLPARDQVPDCNNPFTLGDLLVYTPDA